MIEHVKEGILSQALAIQRRCFQPHYLDDPANYLSHLYLILGNYDYSLGIIVQLATKPKNCYTCAYL